MITILLLILAVTPAGFSFPVVEFSKHELASASVVEGTTAIEIPGQSESLKGISNLLHQQAPSLSEPVIDKVLNAINCATARNVEHNSILTVIDYSLPSSKKRLWIFDLKQKKVLFHTYVSHGIKSGTLFSNFFSNINDSKASSLGVFKTEKSYYGREGLSLRLGGLERHFNDNASNRYIVMHGGWYMDENFIKRYGRAGRSWGCPAVPLSLYKPIINTIKENSLFVAYYPSDEWLVKSQFLNCSNNFPTAKLNALLSEARPVFRENEQRENIIFADIKKNNTLEENDPIVVMSANNYERIYHATAPLGRMLRRQINNVEFIALSNTEFNSIAAKGSHNNADLRDIAFVIPHIIKVNGYYETQMKLVDLGSLKEIQFNPSPENRIQQVDSYTLVFEGKPRVQLKSSGRFIRWVGL